MALQRLLFSPLPSWFSFWPGGARRLAALGGGGVATVLGGRAPTFIAFPWKKRKVISKKKL